MGGVPWARGGGTMGGIQLGEFPKKSMTGMIRVLDWLFRGMIPVSLSPFRGKHRTEAVG